MVCSELKDTYQSKEMNARARTDKQMHGCPLTKNALAENSVLTIVPY